MCKYRRKSKRIKICEEKVSEFEGEIKVVKDEVKEEGVKIKIVEGTILKIQT